MKTLFICFMLLVGALKAGELPGKPNSTELPANALWVKSDVGMWMASYNVWYKVDKKTATLKSSYNKKRWKPAIDAVWHDIHGKWYCIAENKVMMSESGKKWEEVVNRSWQDINGTWFRLDNNFNLYEVVK
ncbi:MAG: hypothetical protein V4677_04170 [Bacteroidota bacterium]